MVNVVLYCGESLFVAEMFRFNLLCVDCAYCGGRVIFMLWPLVAWICQISWSLDSIFVPVESCVDGGRPWILKIVVSGEVKDFRRRFTVLLESMVWDAVMNGPV